MKYPIGTILKATALTEVYIKIEGYNINNNVYKISYLDISNKKYHKQYFIQSEIELYFEVINQTEAELIVLKML